MYNVHVNIHDIAMVHFPTPLETAMRQYAAVMSSLQSCSDMGHTVYGLDVHCDSNDETLLVGPATLEDNTIDTWPPEMHERARELVSKQGFRHAGAVSIVIIARSGDDVHGTVLKVPSSSRATVRKYAAIPFACATSVLACD